MEEIWKDIPEYEGLYQASNLGRIKRLERKIYHYNNIKYCNHTYKEKILKEYIDKQGYILCSLTKNKKSKLLLAHRLIAKTFLENEFNLPEVNHINGIKNDNRIENLEWCDRLYNQKEAERLGLVHSPMRISGYGHPSNKPIYKLNDNLEIEREYFSITNASNEIGVKPQHLSYCIINNKKDKKTKSFWKYKE